MKFTTSIKSSLFLLFIALAASSVGSAQSVGNMTVNLLATPGLTAATCSSSVSSISYGFSDSVVIGTGGTTAPGKPSASSMTILKANDGCSPSYILALFKGTLIPTVTLTISSPFSPTQSPSTLFTITLTNAFVSSVSDTDSVGLSLSGVEKVTLAYESIKIVDSSSNTQVSCNVTTNVCY